MYYRYCFHTDETGQTVLKQTFTPGVNILSFISDTNPELTRVSIVTGKPAYPNATIGHTTMQPKEKRVKMLMSDALMLIR